MKSLFRRQRDALTSNQLLCAYCLDDYLAWQAGPTGCGAPVTDRALTVLPSAGNEPGAGAAVCLAHLQALMRYRRRRANGIRSGDGMTTAQQAVPPESPFPAPMPRSAMPS
jgi:hypothetical protein